MVLSEKGLLATVELARNQGAVDIADIVPHMIDVMNEHEARERAIIASHVGELTVLDATR